MSAWAIVALCCGGFAVLSANISAIVPDSVFVGLHASRLDGGSINQLRAEVANLKDDTVELRRTNTQLEGRFTLKERADGDVARRVGAIEVSLPQILEQIPADGLDSSAITAAIGVAPETVPVEGGEMAVKQTPMTPPAAGAPLVTQPMPAVIVPVPLPDPNAFGLALGPRVTAAGAGAAWEMLNAKVGALLIGMTPLLADGGQLVAGPIATRADAVAACTRMALVGVKCVPQAFVGAPL